MCNRYLSRFSIWEVIAWISFIFFVFAVVSFSELGKNAQTIKQFSGKWVVN